MERGRLVEDLLGGGDGRLEPLRVHGVAAEDPVHARDAGAGGEADGIDGRVLRGLEVGERGGEELLLRVNLEIAERLGAPDLGEADHDPAVPDVGEVEHLGIAFLLRSVDRVGGEDAGLVEPGEVALEEQDRVRIAGRAGASLADRVDDLVAVVVGEDLDHVGGAAHEPERVGLRQRDRGGVLDLAAPGREGGRDGKEQARPRANRCGTAHRSPPEFSLMPKRNRCGRGST